MLRMRSCRGKSSSWRNVTREGIIYLVILTVLLLSFSSGARGGPWKLNFRTWSFHHRSLMEQLRRLRDLVMNGSNKPAQTGACVLVRLERNHTREKMKEDSGVQRTQTTKHTYTNNHTQTNLLLSYILNKKLVHIYSLNTHFLASHSSSMHVISYIKDISLPSSIATWELYIDRFKATT